MRKYLLLYALAVSLLLWNSYHRHRAEIHRLEQNQTALSQQATHYRTQWGQEAASVLTLRTQCDEYKQLRQADATQIQALGYKLRRLESVSKNTIQTRLELRTAQRDTVIVHDTLRLFRWHDAWVHIEGLIDQDSVQCRVESVDTLLQIVHRVPRRFLFFRWGTKAVRQEIISSNPHTRIVYTDYVTFDR